MEQVLYSISLPLKNIGRPFVGLGQHIKDHFIPHARNNYQPHILGQRSLSLLSALLICAKVCAVILLASGPVLPAYSEAITPENIITLTNASRQDYGIAGLKENSMLDVAAQNKANDMLAQGYFAHDNPEGKTPWDFITAAGYNYITAGENLAVNFTQAEDVETAWMNSPEHKANLLNANFQDIGVGISQGQYQGHNAIFVVQEFGTLASQPIAINNTPTKVAPKPAAAPAAAAPQVRADSTQVPAPTPTPVPTPAPLAVSNAQISLIGDSVQITAQASPQAIKVLAYFGTKAVMLTPSGNGLWQGDVATSDLANGDNSVYLRAYSMGGQSPDLHLADFSNSVAANYSVVDPPAQSSGLVNFYGKIINPNNVMDRFYLIFIAVILTCLILAIAIKKHVQHLPMIANASFTAIVACLLLMAR